MTLIKKYLKQMKFTGLMGIVLMSAMIGGSFGLSVQTQAYTEDWQKGVSFQSRGNEDFASDDFKQSVLNATTLGVDHISLVSTYYQYGRYEDQIYEGWNTASENALREGTRYAKSLGLEVSYKLFMETNDGWRAYISPNNRGEWFRNYTNIAVNLGTLAEETGADMIVLGTEMVGVASSNQNSANTGYWYDLIDAVRGVYSGALTYGGNWGGAFDEKNEIEFWDALDYIGVSAYYEPGRAGAYDVESLQNFWNGIDYGDLRPLSEKWGKDIIFTEVGYRSVDFALDRPWDYGSGGNYNPYIQEIAYEGLLSYFETVPYLKGMHMWDYNSAPWYGGEGNTDYTPWNKPAGEVLKKYYNGDGTPAPVTTPPDNSVDPEEEEVMDSQEEDGMDNDTNDGLLFETSVVNTPQTPLMGQEVELVAAVNNLSQSDAEDVLVNIEIYDAEDAKIYQSFMSDVDIAAGEESEYTFLWTPETTGIYNIKVGIFSNNWQNLYSWFNEVKTVEVQETAIGGEPTIDEMPAPEIADPEDEREVDPDTGDVVEEDDSSVDEEMAVLPSDIEVWWPGQGINVNGEQPFKAILQNTPLTEYNMFWQVDGDDYNWMANSQEEFPHKQSIVDLSNWNWKEDGTYDITFIAQDLDGSDTHKQTVVINVR